MGRIPLLVIGGPTAVGKTAIAISVAEAVSGEIINADAMQIYRHMAIGTAQPTAAQRRRVSFHLVDFVDPDQPYSVADFQRDVRQVVTEIADRGHLPILCGGTGLYVRAIVEGFRFPPRPTDPGVRRRLETELRDLGAPALHERLATLDPTAALRIHVHDHKRIVRALEVWELTGRPITQQQTVDGEQGIPYNAAKFAVDRPRPALYEAIDRRVNEMLAAGWVDEARQLLGKGYSPALQSMQALGYGLLFRHLKGELDLGEATLLIQRDTRRLAKRQLTWFRRQAGFTWLSWTHEAEIPQVVERLVTAAQDLRRVAPEAPTPAGSGDLR